MRWLFSIVFVLWFLGVKSQDTTPPVVITLPSDTIYECSLTTVIDSLTKWFQDGAGAVFSDDSGQYALQTNITLAQAVAIFNASQDTLCGKNRSVTVVFRAIDPSGNLSAPYPATFSALDRTPPTIINGPQVNFSCVEGIRDTLINWIKAKGNYQAIDNCSDTIFWTTFVFNIFDKNTGNRISNGRGNINFGPYPVIPDGICNWGMSINFTAIDECGNSVLTPAALYNFNVIDDKSPRFVNPPVDVIVPCNEVPMAEALVRDDCDTQVNVVLTEMSTQSADSLNCGYYNYTLTRTWEATDRCGNIATHTQVLTVIDDNKPQTSLNEDIEISCELYARYPDSLYITSMDPCSPVSISFSDQGQITGCISNIVRTYIVSDICENKDTLIQNIAVIQDKTPILISQAQNTELSCDIKDDIVGLLSNWLDTLGGARAESPCGSLQSFAAIKGSYDPTNVATYPGQSPTRLSSRQCPSPLAGYLSYVEVDFVFYDTCGNYIISPAIFGVADNTKPEIITCQEEYTFTLTGEICETFISIPAPRAIDNCQSGSPIIQRIIRVPVTSNSPPGPEAVVNPLTLRIGPFNSLISPPVTDAEILVRLINLDIDDATEFFIIYDEDDRQIGVTPTGAGQCADTSLTLTLPLADIERWLADDFIELRFEPFLVPGSPVLAINNFCGSSFIETRLEYSTNIENVLELSYQINGGFSNNIGIENTLDILLGQGENSIHFTFMDCAGNNATCTTRVNILDNIPPAIECPPNISSILNTGLCQDTIRLPVNFSVIENCASNRPYNQLSPVSREASLLSFLFNSTTQKVVARDKQIIFTNVFPIRHTTNDVELTIEFRGNNTQLGKQFQIVGPDGTVLGMTSVVSPSTGGCGLSLTTFTIPYDIFNSWISNGSITFIAQANSAEIEPCDVLVSGATNDNFSYINGRLKYSDASFFVSAMGSTTINKTPIPKDDFLYSLVLNQGESDITIYTEDAAGNEASCQFEVNIIDNQSPEAKCKNASLTVNPTGIDDTVIEPQLIDDDSSDNCGIISRTVSPNTLNCQLSGTDVPVTLTVTDISGNTATCSSVIRARAYEVKPTFSSGLCANDTLRLFANMPPNAVPGTYTFHWVGPRAGIEFFTENPAIPNADASYSGVYVVTVRGFNDCVSIGSVTVNVNPITNPNLTPNQEEICQGDEFILTTTRYSDEVEYEWYAGIFPTGVLLTVTTNPELVVKPTETGPLFYYVIASGPDCKSNPSSLVKVTVNARPAARVKDSFLSLCEGENIVLGTDVVGTGFIYTWTGPNGYLERERNPRIIMNSTINEAGNYQLIISNKGCTSDTAITRVVLLERPAAPTIVGNDIFCEGVIFTMVATGVSNVDRYQWFLNGQLFTTTQDNSLIIPNASESLQGIWTVKVIKGTCESEFSQNKAIAIDLALQIGISNPGPVCSGDSITLQATFVPNATYTWQGPRNNIPPVFNPKILATPGDYSVTITTTTGCQNNASTVVTVLDIPEITALSADVLNCMKVSDTIRFLPSVFPTNSTYTYQWNGPSNFSSQERNPVVTGLNTDKVGVYTLTVFNRGCPSKTFEKRVTFTLKPTKPQIQINEPICQGDNLSIFIENGVKGDNYIWNTPAQGQNTIKQDTLLIPNVTNLQNGFYTLVVELENCFSEPSDSLLVLVTPRPSPLLIFGPNTVCHGDTIRVQTQNINGLKYYWSGPNFTSQQSGSFVLGPVSSENSGLYSLFVERDGCFSAESSDILVQVLDEIKKPFIKDNIISLCYKDAPGVEICIEPTTLEEQATYTLWQNSQEILVGNGPCLFLKEADRLNEGLNSLFIRAQKGQCFSEFSNQIFLTINRPPEVEAQAMETDIIICPEEQVRLLALSGPPLVRINWTSPDPNLVIIPSDGRNPIVSQLRPGENTVFLSYSVSGCPDYTIDTVTIYQEFAPVATHDEYTILYGETTVLNFLSNDIFPANSRVTIVRPPNFGNAVIEGNNLLYTPDLRNIQTQTLTYRICTDYCDNLCDEATVTIRIDDNIECKTPTIFTPNNDGINDFFIIPCLETGRYPQNRVSIFNEWGTQVHYAAPYDNNWAGTYGGNPLPVGTYFYVVELEPGRTPINGFLILQR